MSDGKGLLLTPYFSFMDSTHVASTEHYREFMFGSPLVHGARARLMAARWHPSAPDHKTRGFYRGQARLQSISGGQNCRPSITRSTRHIHHRLKRCSCEAYKRERFQFKIYLMNCFLVVELYPQKQNAHTHRCKMLLLLVLPPPPHATAPSEFTQSLATSNVLCKSSSTSRTR